MRGYDPDEEALAGAVERGAVEAAGSLRAGGGRRRSSSVVAAPVARLAASVAEVLEASSGTVTDVGSTKGAVVRAARSDARFIGGHPVCGSEARGPENARAELFDGATWFLTPGRADRSRALPHAARVRVRGRRRPVAVDPDAHDRLVALTSHLPHALANLLVNQAGATRIDGHEPLAAAGGSLRDMTRVAGANPRIWIDIFLDNADAVRESLGEHRRRIEQLEAALALRGRGVPRALDRRGVGQPPAHARGSVRGSRRAAAAARARAGPPGCARRDHAGARRRADQHRGLRAAPHVAGARRRAHRARHGRGARAPRARAARGAGLRASSSRRCVRRTEDRARPARSSGTRSCPATSRSRTAPCCSPRSARGRPRSPASAARATPSRRSRPCARSAPRSKSPTSTSCACAAAGFAGSTSADGPIDAGNAGTLMRLLAGLLAGQEGRFELVGDESLSRRPMERVAAPLRELGAHVETTDGHAPLVVEGGEAARDHVRAAGRERAGEVGRAARGALREGPHDGRRAGGHARPHGAAAAARGSRGRAEGTLGQRHGRRAARARPRRGARRLLVRRAADRRCDAACPAPSSTSTASGSTRRARGCSTCSSACARASRCSTSASSAPSRSPTSRCAPRRRSSRPASRRRGAAHGRRAAARRARSRASRAARRSSQASRNCA